MTPAKEPVDAGQVTIVPANEASWGDLAAIFGTADYAASCKCQRFKIPGWIWRDSTPEGRSEMLCQQTGCGDPDAAATSGLVAYVDGEPAGWVAVEPRTAYPKLRTSRIPWTGREESKDDDGIWAVTCFVVRKGFRGRGLTYLLAQATAGFARSRGARALEAYPMIIQPGKEITWGEAHVGTRQVFEEAGFAQVSRPTSRRVVMRIDFGRQIVALDAAQADDGRLMAVLTELINDVYAVAEEGLWVQAAARTTVGEVTRLVRAGQMAVALEGGQIVGCVRIQLLGSGAGEFGMLAVLPSRRGAGVGRELLRFAEQAVLNERCDSMQLEVLVPRGWSHPSKEFIIGWYTRIGYELTGVDAIEDSYPELAPLLATPCDFATYQRRLAR